MIGSVQAPFASFREPPKRRQLLDCGDGVCEVAALGRKRWRIGRIGALGAARITAVSSLRSSPHSKTCAFPTSCRRELVNPKGILASSPGLALRAYPGDNTTPPFQPQGGCGPTGLSNGTTPLGLKPFSSRFPRVARASQPWALGQNPFGIRPRRTGNGWVMHNSKTLVRGSSLAAVRGSNARYWDRGGFP